MHIASIACEICTLNLIWGGTTPNFSKLFNHLQVCTIYLLLHCNKLKFCNSIYRLVTALYKFFRKQKYFGGRGKIRFCPVFINIFQILLKFCSIRLANRQIDIQKSLLSSTGSVWFYIIYLYPTRLVLIVRWSELQYSVLHSSSV